MYLMSEVSQLLCSSCLFTHAELCVHHSCRGRPHQSQCQILYVATNYICGDRCLLWGLDGLVKGHTMFAYVVKGIFGQHLEDTVQYERKFGTRLAPLLVEQCVDFIREQGLKEEGLFRMPGQANLVKELQDAFDCGDKPLFDR